MNIKCGFEWHIQLNTGKLFCRCNSNIKESEKEDADIKRTLKPSSGESGTVDRSASFEAQREKAAIYRAFFDSDCLVDIDEEPPHDVDQEALKVAYQMASALKCASLDNIIFMRKVIVDGSNTSAFQRTGLIGFSGKFDAPTKTISIDSVTLEEDSARKEKEDQSFIYYKLDRLGIPLVEIATGIIETDENEAKGIALAFGKFTRLFNVRRGIGTIRQDVNLSIEGGSRVELKGFQNIREMDRVIMNEYKRQSSLLQIQKEKNYLLKEMKALEYKEINDVFAATESNIIKKSNSEGKIIIGVRLTSMKGLLGTELFEGKRFGTEVSDYLKIKDGAGIIHSDELPAYGISEAEKNGIAKHLECGENDAFAISIINKNRSDPAVKTFLEKVLTDMYNRISSLLSTVPSEVRLVLEDNSTMFMRPMGGKDRMYVETDLPIVKVSKEIMDSAASYSDLSLEKIEKQYGLSEEFLNMLISSNKLEKAIDLHKKFSVPFSVLVSIMVDDYRYVKRKFGYLVGDRDIEEIIRLISNGTVARDSARFIMESIAMGRSHSVKETIEKFSLKKISRKELENAINKLMTSNKEMRVDTIITNLRDILGHSFDAKDAYEIASKLVKHG